ncbi:MAG: rod shape-determining protein [Gammaproteobacteria bacterium AqS3]|nr:rod shape-determining protein [Gammaproteobacteria bacterium AqS3]
MFKSLRGLFSSDLFIDLGTANTLVYMVGHGIVIDEPSVVAIQTQMGGRGSKVVAVGGKAKEMLGRTPENIRTVRPVRDGVVAELEATEELLQYCINKVHSGSFLRPSPRVMVGVPCMATEVERRAVRDAVDSAGVRQVHLIPEPMAAAFGTGLPVDKATGSVVVDIGGGTTELALMALGGVVCADSVRIGGDGMDEAITEYIRQKYSLVIGESTAEHIKIQIGCAHSSSDSRGMDVRGRNISEGIPQSVQVSSAEICEALNVPLEGIARALYSLLEKAPPELSADIGESGVTLTGGGALLRDIDKYLNERVRVPVHIAENPLTCVAEGGGKAIERIDDAGWDIELL